MIQSVRGTKDILPDDIHLWNFVEGVFKKISSSYGYSELRTPIFEKTEVFVRSIGEETDIVNKEMYSFLDRSNESITLRPEGTAPLVRAVIQNSLIQQSNLLRLWYYGPFFRYERPQKGRQRQFHQYGAECIGSEFPESDAEIISLACDILKGIGIKNFKVLINSLGNNDSRDKYREELIAYLSNHLSELSEDSRRRFEKNPLRVLDSKDEKDIEITNSAPSILDFLDKESIEHFEGVKKILTKLDIDFTIHPKLVRGLDYYNHTVFEFQSSELGAQDSIGGGGRYNQLFTEFGAKQTPAVGFAFGVERLIIILEKIIEKDKLVQKPDIFIVSGLNPDDDYYISLVKKLRNMNLKVITDLNRRSFKAQMKESNRVGAKFALLLGDDEKNSNNITLKRLEDGFQQTIAFDSIENFNFDNQ
ncbi:MAG: histidine--tRNA ligase [Candidatus Kapabacteria bacterium]|nr:histidine--tRNA ligase [Candidatus Kapabacteria bacterium]